MFYRDDMKLIADQASARVMAACGDGIDAVVTVDPTHVGYASTYRSVMLDVSRTYRCAAVVTREKTVIVVGAYDAAPAVEAVRDPSRIFTYGTFYFYDRT